MTTVYGTIPTLSSNPHEADQWNAAGWDLGPRRPWEEMLSPLSIPTGFNQALSHVNTNVSYFLMNYVIIVLFVLFLSLLWNPISLVAFAIAMFAWLFLHFLRDDSINVFGYEVYGRVVVTLLSILSVVLLVTRATANVVAGISVGVAAVVVHAACRLPDGLVGDVERGHPKVDLMEASATSLSSRDETKN